MGKAPAIVKYPIMFLFLWAIAFQSHSRSACNKAIDATKLAQYKFEAAVDDVVIHGASQETLEKEQAAYVKLDKARDEARETCHLPNDD